MKEIKPAEIKRPDNNTVKLEFYKIDKKPNLQKIDIQKRPSTITVEEYKKHKKKNHEEDKFQIEIIQYLRNQYPQLIIIHVPNGGKRTKAEAGIFKALGVLAGVADIVIFNYAKSKYPVIFIELKSKIGKMSPTQKQFKNDVEKLGYKYFLCRTKQEVINITFDIL